MKQISSQWDKKKEVALYTDDLHVWYGDNEAIKGVDLAFEKNKITALIGPSGCGKSTYLTFIESDERWDREYKSHWKDHVQRGEISMRHKSMYMRCVSGSGWFSTAKIRLVNPFMKISRLH